VLLAATSHHWYQISWVDWTTIVGVLLALIGLFLTWRQAKNAANSAEAAKQAVSNTEQRIRLNQLMVLIPQLRWIANELDNAISTEDGSLVRRQLESWRWQAGNIHGMLESVDPNQAKLLRDLQQSVGLARAASSTLMAKVGSVNSECAKVRASIVIASDELNIWLGKSSTQAQDGRDS
jgi:hypothetical protein